MTPMIESRRLRRRFSDAALHYNGLAAIQTALASDLVDKLQPVRDLRVLDVGAGDGVAVRAMAQAGADTLALDAAWGMVQQGRLRSPHTAWVQADAVSLPFAAGQFDCVVSSSAYQWIDDLSRAFTEARRVLKPGGRFVVAMFGYHTLEELFVSIAGAACSGGRTLPQLRRLPSPEAVRSALDQAGFRDPVLNVEKRVAAFDDVKAVLAWLKHIGANGAASNFFWGKTLLAATEKAYRLNFSDGDKLRVTFEIIWIEARLSKM